MRQIRQNVINKFETLIVCLRNRHCRNPQSHDFFSCYGKVFDVKCQSSVKVLWKTKLKQMGKKIGVHMPTIHRLHAKHSLTQSSWMCIPNLETGHCIQLGVSGGRSSEDFGHGVTVNIYLISPRRVLNILMIPLSLPLNWRSIFCGIPPPFILCWRLLIPIKSPPPINEDFEYWSPYITKFSDECFSQYVCLTRARTNTSFHSSAK